MIQEKTLGSFSFDVAKRMLDVLSEHGRWMKKTNLASRAGLNYNVCLRYIQMLNNLGWIDVNPEVSITEQGKGVFAKLLDISEAKASNIGDDDVWLSNLGKKSIEYPCFSSQSITQMKPLAVTGENQRGLRIKRKTSNSKKKTVMIVDDEEDIAQTYESFLSSVGYEVRTFIDSRSALREYVSDCFLYDLLILDIRMKDINGLQLYQSIKAINPECRAIFVSALDAAREVISILPGTRPQDIIRKPVSREQFVTAVKTALAQ
jgi:CheY-like chemotaxis protein/predicted transcriptional regulator